MVPLLSNCTSLSEVQNGQIGIRFYFIDGLRYSMIGVSKSNRMIGLFLFLDSLQSFFGSCGIYSRLVREFVARVDQKIDFTYTLRAAI